MRVKLRKRKKASNLQKALRIAVGALCLILIVFVIWTPRDPDIEWVKHPGISDDSGPIQWPKPISITSPSMYFIHVGKAGGMTLRVHLPVPLAKNKKEIICWQRNESDAANCLAPSLLMNNSALSNHIRGHKHIGSSFFSPDEEDFLISHTDTFLFSIRNPIDRVISAFYYHRNQKKIQYPLFECYDSIHELTGSLAANVGNQSLCLQLARRVLRGNTTAGGLHFAYNYEYYEDETIKKKPEHFVAVIRAEHLWEDAKELDKMVGGNGILEGDGKRYSHYSTSTQQVTTGKAQVTRKGFSTLCCVLAREIASYTRILSRAINLKPSQKQASLRQVQDQCGIQIAPGELSSIAHILESTRSC